MMKVEAYKFWFVVGSQLLYGPTTLAQVEKNSIMIAEGLNKSGNMPWAIEYKGTMKSSEEIEKVIKAANYDDTCAGIITFMHTFSPSKMWIKGLNLLQKPYLHFHTQFNEEIPNEEIDMDYMNLHQSAHGDREHGFIAARMRIPRKIVVGYWKNASVQKRIEKWMRAAVGVSVSQNMKVMRFGDNMREVAVTEGDKVEAQMKFGWEVNTWPVGQLVAMMDQVTEDEIDLKMASYLSKYLIATDALETIRYQAREEIAIQKMLDAEGCMAFSNTFQDLYGMKQLPGLATQNLMSEGYGYGGEGDWKVSAMTAILKSMAFGMTGGTSFMEDYTYDLAGGYSLGAHMLEVCPSLAVDKPTIEVHALGIGNREAPARLVFAGKAGKAVITTLIDMGNRFRLIIHDINCVLPTQTMPNLPVARVMWQAEPNLEIGAEAWIRAGGAHHAVLSYDVDAEVLCDWARMMDIEYVHIHKETTNLSLEHELMLSDLVWKLK